VLREIIRNGQWPLVAALFLLSRMAMPLALLMPLPLKIVIDSVLGVEAAPNQKRGAPFEFAPTSLE
jgi:hypothetical protein